MEKKKFNRGTMVGGIVRIVIALIAVLIQNEDEGRTKA